MSPLRLVSDCKLGDRKNKGFKLYMFVIIIIVLTRGAECTG